MSDNVPPRTVQPPGAPYPNEFYSYCIPRNIQREVFLDWRDDHQHWRRRPGRCVHCHSPASTNLVDDDGRYSHKMCAEIVVYLAGPPLEDAT